MMMMSRDDARDDASSRDAPWDADRANCAEEREEKRETLPEVFHLL